MTTTLDLPSTAQPPVTGLRHPAVLALLLGALGTALTALGSNVPSMWGDEAASVMSAERPWASLFAMAGNVDAVHTFYYAFLHLWIDAFGASNFSVRFPSALAIGAVVAGVFVLTRMFARTGTAVVAALACVIIPRVSYMGAEARSSALATAIVTWTIVLMVRIIRDAPTRPRLFLYGAALLVGTHLFLYSILFVVVYAVMLIVLRADRRTVLRWLVATGITALLCVPFAILSMSQRGQIAFLAHRPEESSPGQIAVDQWFGNIPFAVVAWAFVVGAAVAAFLSWQAARRHVGAGASPAVLPERTAFTVIVLAWLLVPTILLLAANAVIGPLYTLRYLSFSAPAAAVLIAMAIAAVPFTTLRVVAAALVLVVAVPIAVDQRSPYAKAASDWSEVSDYIGAHSAAGDGIVFDDSVRSSRKPRLALHLYPDGFTKVDDLELVTGYADTAELWDVVTTLSEDPELLDGHDRVWVVSRSKTGTAEDENALLDAGYQLVDTHKVHVNVIRLYERVSS